MKFLRLGLVGLFLGAALPASAIPLILSNGDFAAGQTGWTLDNYGFLQVVGPGTLGVGTSGARLFNNGSLTPAAGEADLKLTPGSLTPLGLLPTSGGPAFTGSVLYTSVTSGSVGDTISFVTRFNGEDSGYDFGFASLAGSGSAQQVQLIGAGDGTVPPPFLMTFTLTQGASLANPLIFGFGSYNTLDDFGTSSISMSQEQPKVSEIDPKSSTAPLAFTIFFLLLVGGGRKRVPS